MYFQAVAIDYDGTLARHGVVAPRTLAALKKCKESGRKLILVTGRQVDDLRIAFPDFATFDLIVGENGAVIFKPATCEERAIAECRLDVSWSFCENAASRHCPLANALSRLGSRTRKPCSRRSATLALNCKSSSTRAR